MRHTINEEHKLGVRSAFYIHKMDHRDARSLKKSQWTIPHEHERECLVWAFSRPMQDALGKHRWALHITGAKPLVLGRTKAEHPPIRDSFYARFIDSNENNKWHGYPADHVLNEQDIPPNEVLDDWAPYLRPALIRKILKSQPGAL